MTIIEPNRQRQRWNGFIAAFIITVALGSIANIVLYTQTVDLRHNISQAETDRQKRTVATAQLKDSLYQVLDTESLQQAATQLGLVLETKPAYLKLTPGN